MSDLPPFSSDDPTCVKCGHEEARTIYRPTGICINNGADLLDSNEGRPNERLCRYCLRCGYHWDEAVVAARAAEEMR